MTDNIRLSVVDGTLQMLVCGWFGAPASRIYRTLACQQGLRRPQTPENSSFVAAFCQPRWQKAATKRSLTLAVREPNRDSAALWYNMGVRFPREKGMCS